MLKGIFRLAGLWIGMAVAVVQAWDGGGHRLVNQFALRGLKPEVIRQIEPLLPLLDTRGHGGQPYDFINAGTWMDDLRAVSREWAAWHFIDVPCAGNAYVEPQPPHAVWALDRAVEVLRSRDADPKARAEALGQVMHLVADVHQPLHTASRNGDRGGNGVAIVPLDGLERPNLHAFWDAAYRFDAEEGCVKELWPAGIDSATELEQQFDVLLTGVSYSEAAFSIDSKPWHQWARETHELACKNGWPENLPPKGTPTVLTPAFVHQAHQIAARQIVLAGIRLVEVLNQALASQP